MIELSYPPGGLIGVEPDGGNETSPDRIAAPTLADFMKDWNDLFKTELDAVQFVKPIDQN